LLFSQNLWAQPLSTPFSLGQDVVFEGNETKQIISKSVFSNSGNADEQLSAMFDAVTDSLWEHYEMVSLSSSVVLPDGSVWQGATGLSSNVLPITTDHRLAMGSISKTITAAGILKLQDMELLSINDTIGTWLSGYQHISGQVTIRQLLQHRSGIAEYLNNTNLIVALNQNLDSVWNAIDILEHYMLPPAFSPGTSWQYSNTNYLIAGVIIEMVTGQNFHDAIRDLVFEPNGQESIRLFPQESIGTPYANVWGDIGFGTVIDMHAAGIGLTSLFSSAWAAGAYYTRTDELGQWMHALLSGDILSEAALNEMKNDFVLGPQMGYGLGIIRLQIGTHTAYGHNGYIYYGASSYYIPSHDITITAMTNDGGFEGDNWPAVIAAYIKAYEDWLNLPINTNNLSSPVDFQLFPNPASDMVCIGDFLSFDSIFSEGGEVVVYNIKGVKLKQQPIHSCLPGSGCIQLSGLSPGMYSVVSPWMASPYSQVYNTDTAKPYFLRKI
jgi:D-alanyl-D-alanine carboxypeptidase